MATSVDESLSSCDKKPSVSEVTFCVASPPGEPWNAPIHPVVVAPAQLLLRSPEPIHPRAMRSTGPSTHSALATADGRAAAVAMTGTDQAPTFRRVRRSTVGSLPREAAERASRNSQGKKWGVGGSPQLHNPVIHAHALCNASATLAHLSRCCIRVQAPVYAHRVTPPLTIDEFWQQCRAVLPELPAEAPEAWAFGATPAHADGLLALVLAGTKTATASSLWDYEHTSEALPAPGLLNIILDGQGNPRALLETASIEVVPFNEVTAEHAFAEGEGDLSLEYWREVHERFWREHSENPRGFAPNMPVVCERLRMLHAV